MSTRLKEKKERLERLIANLAEESAEGKPIVVEGKNDAETLHALGVNGPILMVKSGGKSFFEVITEIESLSSKEIILLLDFDRRGTEGTIRLQRDLEKSKIKVNARFWNELRGLIGRDLQCVEGLDSYMRTLTEKTV